MKQTRLRLLALKGHGTRINIQPASFSTRRALLIARFVREFGKSGFGHATSSSAFNAASSLLIRRLRILFSINLSGTQFRFYPLEFHAEQYHSPKRHPYEKTSPSSAHPHLWPAVRQPRSRAIELRTVFLHHIGRFARKPWQCGWHGQHRAVLFALRCSAGRRGKYL